MQKYFGNQPPEPVVVDPFTGIVTFLAEGEKLRSDPDIFVVAAQSAFINSLHDVQHLSVKNHRVHGSGAGLTYNDALNAAVGETVERYAFGVVHPEDLTLATYQEMVQQGKTVLEPERWALFHPSQAGKLPYALFQHDTPIAWVLADHLVKKQEVYVPACLVYSPYFGLMKDQGEKVLAPAISTGSACAHDHQDAILKGICEVIERDAFMIMWRNQLTMPKVEIDPESELFNLFQDTFDRDGLEFHIFQTTMDLSIPSFFGVVVNRRNNPPNIMVGGACHPNPQRAVLKTLIELSQGLQWMNHVGDQVITPKDDYSDIRSFDDRMYLYSFGDQIKHFDFLLSTPNRVQLSHIQNLEQNSTRESVQFCLDVLQAQQINVLAIDLTTIDVAECGLRVIKVLLPECVMMEGDHNVPFLGGQRWQTVPVKMGLKSSPTKIEKINPAPHPYP